MPTRSPLLNSKDFTENTQILQNNDTGTFFDEDLDGDDDLGFRYDNYQRKKNDIVCQKRSLICYIGIGIILSLVLGIIIGRFSVNGKVVKHDSILWNLDDDVRNRVINEIKAENIRENLKTLTSKPHLAGSDQDEVHLVNFIKDRWSSSLDAVEVYPYDVMLSFPNSTDKNFVGILYENGTVTNHSTPDEQPVTDFERNADVVSAFNAYSPPGHVEGSLYYVNYGREEDFLYLSKQRINLTGSICIARYGRSFRGDKAKAAEKYHCSALILYSDPHDYAGAELHSWQPSSEDTSYPHTWWLPSTGFQRGSLGMNGDPLTPDYPSLNFTYRIPENETNLPNIPVLPISYKDAYQYLSILNGSVAPSHWQGGLKFEYRFGGSFVETHANCKAVIHVSNYHQRKTIHTVIGYIRGWLEPDRYVLMGNHRDAWTFGGADPSSGTAVLLEVSRVIGNIVQEGKWRPRRTIVFCSWAAEEYGLIGSTEWTEQMEKMLLLQAVSYLNIDIAVEGNVTFRAYACPSLQHLLYNVTKSVKNPNVSEINEGRSSVFDTWLHYIPDKISKDFPYVRSLGSGSDYTSFLQKAGVASTDIRYTFNYHEYPSYPVYHSLHDTFEYFENFLDKEFNYSVAIASVAADSILQLSGSVILPLNPTDTAHKLSIMAGTLQNTYKDVFDGSRVSLQELNRTISLFNRTAHELMLQVEQVNQSTSDIQVRRINDKLFYINRGFLDFNGLPGRHYYRNVVFAPSSHNSYSNSEFPAVADAAYEVGRGGSLSNVKKALSVLCTEVLSAVQIMKGL